MFEWSEQKGIRKKTYTDLNIISLQNLTRAPPLELAANGISIIGFGDDRYDRITRVPTIEPRIGQDE